MSTHYHIDVADENAGHTEAWWTETIRMFNRGWVLFCAKRNMQPSEIASLDVKRRKGRKSAKQKEADADQDTSP